MEPQAFASFIEKQAKMNSLILDMETYLKDEKKEVSQTEREFIMSSGCKLTQAYLACSAKLVELAPYAYDHPLKVGNDFHVSILRKLSDRFSDYDFVPTLWHRYEDDTTEMEEQLEDEEDEETLRALKAKIEHRKKVLEARDFFPRLEEFELLFRRFELDLKTGRKEYAKEKARFKVVRAGGFDDPSLANEYTKAARIGPPFLDSDVEDY